MNPMNQDSIKSSELARIPTPFSVKVELARNAQERRIIWKLLRLAEDKERTFKGQSGVK